MINQKIYPKVNHERFKSSSFPKTRKEKECIYDLTDRGFKSFKDLNTGQSVRDFLLIDETKCMSKKKSYEENYKIYKRCRERELMKNFWAFGIKILPEFQSRVKVHALFLRFNRFTNDSFPKPKTFITHNNPKLYTLYGICTFNDKTYDTFKIQGRAKIQILNLLECKQFEDKVYVKFFHRKSLYRNYNSELENDVYINMYYLLDNPIITLTTNASFKECLSSENTFTNSILCSLGEIRNDPFLLNEMDDVNRILKYERCN